MTWRKRDSVGRPPRYRSLKELEERIEAYFKRCEGAPATDKDGQPMLDKLGRPVMTGSSPPTVTGLALALGFKSRQSLLNYEEKPQYAAAIQLAKSRVEAYAECRLFDREGVRGAQFSLKNNFEGWKDGDREERVAEAELERIRREERARIEEARILEDVRRAVESDGGKT